MKNGRQCGRTVNTGASALFVFKILRKKKKNLVSHIPAVRLRNICYTVLYIKNKSDPYV